jgi:hypothetical protein
MSGCSLFGPDSKRKPEVVPSCFSDGENQAALCKSQRVNEDGKTVVTRCIGSQNPESKAILRGKCVEKICSEGSNTDCQIKGEFGVLEQYTEIVTAKLFAADEAAAAKESVTPTPTSTVSGIGVKPALRPAKKSRTPTKVKEVEKGIKKVCVAKKDLTAPKVLRGKCAIRNCTNGKCTYQGRKEMFDWVAR